MKLTLNSVRLQSTGLEFGPIGCEQSADRRGFKELLCNYGLIHLVPVFTIKEVNYFFLPLFDAGAAGFFAGAGLAGAPFFASAIE